MTKDTPQAAPQSSTNTTLLRSDSIPTVYVEGVSQVMIGIPNSRMIFHDHIQRQEADGNREEVRHIALEVVMPTSAIIDMVTNLTAQLVQSRDKYVVANAEWTELTTRMMAALEMPKQPSAGNKTRAPK
jgi:hypothetical protein